ncbi:hypothetical protein P4S72_18290 [Vibrio sp. PP-XX7]
MHSRAETNSLTQQAGVFNVNGGDTYSTNDNPTLSSTAPLARP